MDRLPPPNPLSFEGNIAESWKRFKHAIGLYAVATGVSEKTEPVKIATFLHIAGEEAVNVFNGFNWNEEGDVPGDDKIFDKVLAKFEKHCAPKGQNKVYYQHKFFTRNQTSGESYDKYIGELFERNYVTQITCTGDTESNTLGCVDDYCLYL